MEKDEVRRRTIVRNAAGVETGTVSAFPGGRPSRMLANTTWRVGAVYQDLNVLTLHRPVWNLLLGLLSLLGFATSITGIVIARRRLGRMQR